LETSAGAAVFDSEGNLWSVQGGVLVQYDGHGHALQQIVLAREAAASVAFGGRAWTSCWCWARRVAVRLAARFAKGLAPGVADTLFVDSGSASTAGLHA
jgi:L-arabinonolactonase